jgi:hypothetical protein
LEDSISSKNDGSLIGSHGVVPGHARDGPLVGPSLFAAESVVGLV